MSKILREKENRKMELRSYKDERALTQDVARFNRGDTDAGQRLQSECDAPGAKIRELLRRAGSYDQTARADDDSVPAGGNMVRLAKMNTISNGIIYSHM